MRFIGLFLSRDIMSLEVALYPICYFGQKAILAENKINKLKSLRLAGLSASKSSFR